MDKSQIEAGLKFVGNNISSNTTIVIAGSAAGVPRHHGNSYRQTRANCHTCTVQSREA